MAYPTSLDSFTTVVTSDTLPSMGGLLHSAMHTAENVAIVALETKVGVDGSAVTSTHEYKLAHTPRPLFDHYVDAGNGTTVETDLYSDTTAAGQLANNGDKINAEYGGVFVSSGTATREVRIYFAGTAIFDTGALTLSLSSAWTCYVTIIRVSATVIRYMVSFTTEGAALAAYTAVGAVTGLTLSGTNIIKVTGQAAGIGAASADIVAKLGNVQYAPAA